MKTKASLLAAAAIAVAATATAHSAPAGSPGPSSLLRLSASPETAPTAAVVSEVAFNTYVPLTCGAVRCYAKLPVVLAGQRLNLQFASCSAEGGGMLKLHLFVTDAKVTKVLGGNWVAFIPQSVVSSVGVRETMFVASHPLPLVIQANRLHLETHSRVGQATYADCWLTGVSQKLK